MVDERELRDFVINTLQQWFDRPVDGRQTIFELGGDSLMAMMLIQEVGSRIDSTVRATSLFDASSIDEFVETVIHDLRSVEGG
jgi:acyl carrier protein